MAGEVIGTFVIESTIFSLGQCGHWLSVILCRGKVEGLVTAQGICPVVCSILPSGCNRRPIYVFSLTSMSLCHLCYSFSKIKKTTNIFFKKKFKKQYFKMIEYKYGTWYVVALIRIFLITCDTQYPFFCMSHLCIIFVHFQLVYLFLVNL